jgi:hypothetical protein
MLKIISTHESNPEKVVKEEDVELGAICPSVLQIAAEQFGEKNGSIESFFEQLKALEYFPKKLAKPCVHLKDLARLCYLTILNEKSNKSPFTAEDVKTFKTSFEVERQTEGWFKRAIIPFVLISGASYISFIAASDLSDEWQAGIAGTVGMVASVAINMVSLCITGTNPHRSKDIDNQKQNTIHGIISDYDEMAKELILLNKNKKYSKLAKHLAEQIDLKLIFKLATEKSYLDPMEAKRILKKLKDAIKFVKGERNYLRHHDLALFAQGMDN